MLVFLALQSADGYLGGGVAGRLVMGFGFGHEFFSPHQAPQRVSMRARERMGYASSLVQT